MVHFLQIIFGMENEGGRHTYNVGRLMLLFPQATRGRGRGSVKACLGESWRSIYTCSLYQMSRDSVNNSGAVGSLQGQVLRRVSRQASPLAKLEQT